MADGLPVRRHGAWAGAYSGLAARRRTQAIWILADVRCRTSDVRHRIIPMLHTMSYVMHVRHRTPMMSYVPDIWNRDRLYEITGMVFGTYRDRYAPARVCTQYILVRNAENGTCTHYVQVLVL